MKFCNTKTCDGGVYVYTEPSLRWVLSGQPLKTHSFKSELGTGTDLVQH